jgi:HEAT repeat protein
MAYADAKRRRSGDSEERLYRRGAEYMDRREWEKAIDEYDQVIERHGVKADGALYWKAYSFSKLGRRDPALAALAELKKSYPSSRWLNDAKALEAEVQQASGQGPSPENTNDEELKLFAINALMNTDPERAMPLLEKILQKNTSPKLRERALFVLAQNHSAKSNEIVAQFARGGGNPDLQLKAVEYLGVYGGRDNVQVLGDIYGSAQDPALKRTILRSFMVAHDKDRLLSAAKSEQNPDVRRDAIQYLGNLNAYPELAQLYSSESTVEGKESIIQALANGGNSDRLLEIAKSEKEPRLRSAAIHRLANMGKTRTSEALVSLYSSETERSVKEEIIRSLSNQGSAKELVDIAKKESDPKLRETVVHRLSNMKSKEGSDFFMELLNK